TGLSCRHVHGDIQAYLAYSGEESVGHHILGVDILGNVFEPDFGTRDFKVLTLTTRSVENIIEPQLIWAEENLSGNGFTIYAASCTTNCNHQEVARISPAVLKGLEAFNGNTSAH